MRTPDRRQALALALGAAGMAARPAAAAPQTPSLKDAARAGGLVFGAAAGPEVFTDAAYRDLIFEQCAIFVPENALKFDYLQPEQGHYNFAPADAMVDEALRHGVPARGVNLFWDDWLPSWTKTLSRREVEHVFETHLETVVPHFAGRLQSWDVVNEPFWLGSDKPGTFRPGLWYDALGPDYIFRAFRRTAALDTHAKLVLNEAWTDRADAVGAAVRRSLLRLIDEMLDKGLKLDVVGLESHLMPQVPYDDARYADFLHAIGERGLDIYISELDVDDAPYKGDDAARDAAVAARTRSYLDAVLAVPAVKMVITWGLSDRYTWYRDANVMVGYGLDRLLRPLPYDDMLRRKPMAEAMTEAFARRRPSSSRG